MFPGDHPVSIPGSVNSTNDPRTYSAQNNNYSERTPLLNHTYSPTKIFLKICKKVFVAILILILIFGLLIGSYLMATEGHEHVVSRKYNYTPRELWKAHVPSTTMLKLKLPAQKVLLLQSNSSRGCDGKSHCAKLVRELQLQHMTLWKEPDIQYNFVVSEDGSIFEGRGWKFQSNLSRNFIGNAVTIAFLGTFHGNLITRKQALSTKLFMDEAILEGKLENCVDFQIWGDTGFFITLLENMKYTLSPCHEVT